MRVAGGKFALAFTAAIYWLLVATTTLAQNNGAFFIDDGAGASNQAVPAGNAVKLDMRRVWVFGAGIHKFQDDHLHGGRQAVVAQDYGLLAAFSRRGVPDSHIIGLLDDEATSENCKAALQTLIQQAQPGDFLFVFLHSHGARRNGGLIATYETGGSWNFASLIDQIESGFAGSHACLCVAACHSGSLFDTITSAPRRVNYFGITSVHPDVSALTVATADFQACLRDAIDGSPCPDLNNDGVTTFAEMGRYLRDDQATLFHTLPQCGHTSAFNPDTVVGPARAKDGEMDCALVRNDDGDKGRVIKQDGNRLLVRGSKNPREVEWVRRGNVRRL